MAFAKATQAQQLELQRQLNIIAKMVYRMTTHHEDVSYTGHNYDSAVVALEAAIAAVKAAK